MNQEFMLGKLSEIMNWDTERSREEFAWLNLMSKMKYDGYQDFRAGVRFIESLADWLQQFPTIVEREIAYEFIRRHLVYLGPGEMNHLVELFFPETVQWRLVQEAAQRAQVPKYQVWANPEALKIYQRLLRQTLFIELSDGARIDIFRRINAGVVSNEQVVTAPRINQGKWDDLLKDLRKDLDDPEARFAFVFLVDDFTASGTTLLRCENGRWNGKMYRFWEDVQDVTESPFEPEWVLCVHHYLATYHAKEIAKKRHEDVLAVRRAEGLGWFERVKFSYGLVLPKMLPITEGSHTPFLELIEKYYDKSIEDRHMRLGGEDARLGFGKCALPLVLEHNTPNNSLALIWADTRGDNGAHPMRPLFRRRQRHT